MSDIRTQPLETRGFELSHFQSAAVKAWIHGDASGSYRGTLEIVTGGGKTLVALACAEAASKECPDLRLIIVTPTLALAEQWRSVLVRYTNLSGDQIGRLSGESKDFDESHRAVVTVINSASRNAARLGREPARTMLIVDECHRAGAPTFQNVLNIGARYRLGLSATPERDEIDAYGEPLRFDEQVVGKRLGRVVFTYGIADATRDEWLPEYVIFHHAVQLHGDERAEYERQSRKIDDLADNLRHHGVEPGRARAYRGKADDIGMIAQAYLNATTRRKDLLFRAKERARVAVSLARHAFESPVNRVLLFNERISEASRIYDALRHELGDAAVRLEHSQLPQTERSRSLEDFRNGDVRILVSAKSLIEGIDVPHANVGISVSSTSSIRQRIQSLGRVLRRFSSSAMPIKRAEMHLIYVSESVDETIYSKEDWSDLTGSSRNLYRLWSTFPEDYPAALPGPPREPLASEETEHQRLQGVGAIPQRWLGSLKGHEYSIDTRGNVFNEFDIAISNPQNVSEMLLTVRGVPGGRFIVTPRYRYVLVAKRDGDDTQWFAAGRLIEAFVTDEAEQQGLNQPPGQYSGPLNAKNGTYKIRSRSGGTIERSVARNVVEFASVDGSDAKARNARDVISAWRKSLDRGLEFYVNDRWDAWYRQGGRAHFLAHVPGGFNWPDD